jgi:triacylglycerol esterase/lipase EstA (alpha/beta hydrolase family)
MHSVINRAQNVFGYFTTVASVVALVIALSAFAVPQKPTANLKLRNIQVYVCAVIVHAMDRD